MHLPAIGDAPCHSCSLERYSPVGMPCASPAHHAWSVYGGESALFMQCLARLASGNDGGSEADAEEVGRVNPGRRCCLCKDVCVQRCMTAEGRAGYSRASLHRGAALCRHGHSTVGTCRLLRHGGYRLFPGVEGLRHFPFL